MAEQTLTVALMQMACSADRDSNARHITDQLRAASAQGVQLVLLQELHYSRYFCQSEHSDHFDLAEPIPGPGTDHLSGLAKELQLVIVASLFERRAAGLYHNTAVVLDRDGSLAGKYRKMHIPDDPGYYEKFYFTPGDLGFQPIRTRYATLGVGICWDQWLPETARLLLQQGLSTMVSVMCGDPGTMRFSQIILREQMAPTAAFDLIYPKVMERMLSAFSTLIATITGETDPRQCSLQAILLMGQVMVFRAGRATVVRRIGMEGYTAREIAEIQELVVSRAMAALDFMAARQA